MSEKIPKKQRTSRQQMVRFLRDRFETGFNNQFRKDVKGRNQLMKFADGKDLGVIP